MEKTMSVDEKIRKAEEIALRRKGVDSAKTNYEQIGNSRKNKSIVRKTFTQIIVCIFIYTTFYIFNNSNWAATNQLISKTNEILNYNIDLKETANYIVNQMQSFINKLDDNVNNNENANGENQDTTDGNNNQENNESNGENNASNEGNAGTMENQSNGEDSSNQDENGGEAAMPIATTGEEQNGIGGENIEQTESEQQIQNTEENKSLTAEEQMQKDSEEIKSTINFIKPISGRITSQFGPRNPTTSTVPKNHTGVDIAANLGTVIHAATDGTVILASGVGDYGNHLKIQINDVVIIYAHCNKLYVKEGDIIVQGQEIGEVGSTGNSTGPHLHFEVRKSDRLVNPQMILEL